MEKNSYYSLDCVGGIAMLAVQLSDQLSNYSKNNVLFTEGHRPVIFKRPRYLDAAFGGPVDNFGVNHFFLT